MTGYRQLVYAESSAIRVTHVMRHICGLPLQEQQEEGMRGGVGERDLPPFTIDGQRCLNDANGRLWQGYHDALTPELKEGGDKVGTTRR